MDWELLVRQVGIVLSSLPEAEARRQLETLESSGEGSGLCPAFDSMIDDEGVVVQVEEDARRDVVAVTNDVDIDCPVR
jgi:hypothetical protein